MAFNVPVEMTSPKHGVRIYKINHDVNGNPRFVVHYTAAPDPNEGEPASGGEAFIRQQNEHITYAAKVFCGKRYRAKWFGGGIVFQTYMKPEVFVDAAIDAALRGESVHEN